jgi:hypothetical protein
MPSTSGDDHSRWRALLVQLTENQGQVLDVYLLARRTDELKRRWHYQAT